MRKLLTSLLVFLLAVTSVFGLTGIKSVKAEETAVAGIELVGASLRADLNDETNDLTGIRFTTTVSQEAYDAIIRKAGESEVIFGTKITDIDGNAPQYIAYNTTASGKSGYNQVTGAFEYHASITFNNEQFELDVLRKYRQDNTLTSTEDATEQEKNVIAMYKAYSYAELLVATSYYEIGGVKYYTQSLTRSMRNLANYYDKDTDFVLSDAFKAKNYIVAGKELKGYLKENGEVVVDGLENISGFTTAGSPEALAFTEENGYNVTVPSLTADSLGTDVTLYAFEKNNRVNVLTLKYVTDIISTAEDLKKFDVGYKFSEADYNAADDKDAYLAKIAADPFDYYNGYYVLTNDIDASNVKFDHEAVTLVYTRYSDHGLTTGLNVGIGFQVVSTSNSETNKSTVTLAAKGPGATITTANGSYNIPRSGYPIVMHNYHQQSNNRWYLNTGIAAGGFETTYDIGFRGTFDGQGHTITGLNQTSRDAVKYYAGEGDNEDGQMSGSISIGAGLFGVLGSDAVIKNVAFTDVNVSNSSGLATYVVGHVASACNLSVDNVYWGNTKNGRPIIEDVYIETAASADNYGVIASINNRGRGLWLDHVIVNAPSHTNATIRDKILSTAYLYSGYYNAYGYIVGGDAASASNINTSLTTIATQSVVIAQVHEFYSVAGVKNYTYQDITRVTSINDLWTAKTFANEEISIQQAFSDREYWDVIDNKVYFKGHYEKGLNFVNGEAETVESVELDANNNSYKVSLANGYGDAVEATVKFNTDALTYENGFIKLVSSKPGVYEATFTYGDYSKTLTVQILAETITTTGYLQEDGEVVAVKGLNIDAIENATYAVNGIIVDGEVRNGKIYVDLSELGATTYMSDVEVTISTTSANYEITAKYVTVAIDEASDLLVFNVGYKYNEADYNLATDKNAYLAKIAADPFDYAEGYYVLTKDIDATGIVFNHEAVMPYDDAGVTFAITASADGFADAGTVSGATIGGYVIPREGFPVKVATVSHVKVGFRGTFDGQGHTLSNVDSTRETTLETKGMGLFGAITNGAVIKNVAFVDIHCNVTVGFAYALVGGNTSGAVYANVRPLYQNVYIKVADNGSKTVVSHGLFANSGYANRTTNKNGDYRFEFIDVVVDATTIYNDSGVFSSSGFNNDNNGLRAFFTNFFIATNARSYTNETNYGAKAAKKRGNHTDAICAFSMEELFAKTNFYADGPLYTGEELDTTKTTTMATELASNPYFEVFGNAVYWNGMYEKSFTFEDGEDNKIDEVELSGIGASQEVNFVDPTDTAVANPIVSFNVADVLAYENGAIVVKQNVVGSYEATFTYKVSEEVSYSKTITVDILAPTYKINGYIQEDGEVVAEGLDVSLLEGATYQVNGVATTGEVKLDEVVNKNKAYAYAKLTGTEYLADVEVQISSSNVNYVITAKYVSLAIDEAEDLKKFNVGYKFSEADYNNASDKDAYLQEKASNPFDYYEGYYVLTKDIDAGDIKFAHEAAVLVYANIKNSVNTEVGFYAISGISEDGTNNIVTLEAHGAGAVLYGTDGVTAYNIPRAGYPVVQSSYFTSNSRWYLYQGIAAAGFETTYDIGFNGTFDGQGYVISNLNKTSRDAVSYYLGADDNADGVMSGSATIGAGLFGVIGRSATIKNVAFTNVNVSNSAGLAMFVTGHMAYDCSALNNKSTYAERPLVSDVYISTAESASNYGILATYNDRNRGWFLDHVIINAPSHTEKTMNDKYYSGLHANFSNRFGYILGGDNASNNNAFVTYAKQSFVIAQTSELALATTRITQDIVQVATESDLWSQVTKADATVTIQAAYTDRDMWVVKDTNDDGIAEVIFKGLNK